VYTPKKNGLINKDVNVTFKLFDSLNTDKLIREKQNNFDPSKDTVIIEKNDVYKKNNINDLTEELRAITFESIGDKLKLIPLVDHINKTVNGRINYSTNAITSEPIKITFVPDYEEDTYGDYGDAKYGSGIKNMYKSKWIEARLILNEVPEGEWKRIQTQREEDGSISVNNTIEYTFEQNGSCEIEIRDSVGNGGYKLDANGEPTNELDPEVPIVRIPVVVDWIISGEATTAVTSNVLENGTVFTDLLINAATDWNITDAQEQIKINLYRILDDGTIEKETDEKHNKITINKMQIKDYNEQPINETTIGKGLYYITLGIGGNGVFVRASEEVESTRYILEIDLVNSNSEIDKDWEELRDEDPEILIHGKNRIEVTVNKLNHLT